MNEEQLHAYVINHKVQHQQQRRQIYSYILIYTAQFYIHTTFNPNILSVDTIVVSPTAKLACRNVIFCTFTVHVVHYNAQRAWAKLCTFVYNWIAVNIYMVVYSIFEK